MTERDFTEDLETKICRFYERNGKMPAEISLNKDDYEFAEKICKDETDEARRNGQKLFTMPEGTPTVISFRGVVLRSRG